MQSKIPKTGFTLIEMIVAIGLLGAVSALTSAALVNIMKTNKAISINQPVIEDARTVINLLVLEIQNNAIDYQEYFNRNTCAYNVGFGVDCPSGFPQYNENFKSPAGIASKDAVCNPNKGQCNSVYQSYLYLRSLDGMKKIIYGIKKTDKPRDTTPPEPEQVLAVLNLEGCDEDKNGVPEKFVMEDYFCSNTSDEAKPPADIELTESGSPYVMAKFHPVSLNRTDVVDLKFYISPNNDPHKAYNDADGVYQPKVAIVLTAKPSASAYGGAVKNTAPVIIQATASQKYLGEIKN